MSTEITDLLALAEAREEVVAEKRRSLSMDRQRSEEAEIKEKLDSIIKYVKRNYGPLVEIYRSELKG